jgi:hypothetical protein
MQRDGVNAGKPRLNVHDSGAGALKDELTYL